MFKNMNKKLIVIIVGGILLLSAVIYVTHSIVTSGADTIGAMRPSGISVRIRQDLVSGASRSGTTLVIDPIITKDGHRVVMSDIGSTSFGKIDQGNSSEEIVSWTGITDNTTTYTLTGVVWGYNFYNTATSTANYKKHVAGASFIITNDDHALLTTLLNYVHVATTQTIIGLKTFILLPRLASYIIPTADEEFAPKKYVDDVALAGAPDASTITKGVIQFATKAQAALGTILGSTGAMLGLPSSMATSSNDVATTSIPVTRTDGTLNPNFYQSNTNVWSGTNSGIADTIYINASTTITGATTPQPVYINSVGALELSNASSTATSTYYQYIGFAITSGTNGQSVLVQRNGIVKGFTGLTPGADYYIGDVAGTITTNVLATSSVATSAPFITMKIGKALSATTLLLDRQKMFTDVGISMTNDTTYTAYADAQVTCTSGDGSAIQSDIKGYINGLQILENKGLTGSASNISSVGFMVSRGDTFKCSGLNSAKYYYYN